MPNVLIKPHTAGETRRYEDNVIDLLLENLDRLGRGESALLGAEKLIPSAASTGCRWTR